MPSSRSPFPSPALRVPLRYGSEMRLDGIRKASSPLMSFPLPLPSLERSEGQRTEVAKEVGKEVIRLMNETTTDDIQRVHRLLFSLSVSYFHSRWMSSSTQSMYP